jgi:hypothetical protein
MWTFDLISILVVILHFAALAFLVFVFYVLLKLNRFLTIRLALLKGTAEEETKNGASN